jgi:hypothetical protein
MIAPIPIRVAHAGKTSETKASDSPNAREKTIGAVHAS